MAYLSGLQASRDFTNSIFFENLAPRAVGIIIIINILYITCMQVIYNYIPETNQVSRVYCVAAVLYLRFALHVMLFHP
jgi:hypothetical protein